MYLVESDDERRAFALKQVDRLDGLLLETVHEIDDEYGNVTER